MAAAEPRRLVLASTSRYRRELLARFGLPFDCVAPGVDENRTAGEAPAALAARLAAAKADAVAGTCPQAVVIGSDQVAELDGEALGKPGHADAAFAQLRACSGREVCFHTAVCVVVAQRAARHAFTDITRVRFRALADEEIARYLAADQPFDCAGSFKSEALGCTLFDAIHCEDPTALVGLPLIGVARALRACGYRLP
jgi:septum formation protein